jgi:hypothetical protein
MMAEAIRAPVPVTLPGRSSPILTAMRTPATTSRWPALSAWTAWALIMSMIPISALIDVALRRTGRADLVLLTPEAYPLVLAALSASTVGALVAARRPRHPVGWLLLLFGGTIAFSGLATAYAALSTAGRSAPGAALALVIDDGLFIVWPSCIGFILLLTPDGRLPSRRWRPWAVAATVAPVVFLVTVVLWPLPLDPPNQDIVSPLALPAAALRILGPLRLVTVILPQLNVVAGAIALVVRFRRARGLQRQQLRWVALAGWLSLAGALAVLAGMAIDEEAIFVGAATAYAIVLPLAVGAAVTRYRLYDLDRIISRTVAYGVLTVLLGAGYAVVALVLGQFVGGQRSLVVAAATLAVAAAFQPARRRVQRMVDRRFDRRRYDAARTIEGFSARLRQEVNLDTLTVELLHVVDQTMQPATAEVWLRR